MDAADPAFCFPFARHRQTIANDRPRTSGLVDERDDERRHGASAGVAAEPYRSTQNAFYIDQIPVILAGISAGNSICECFTLAGGYPEEFLDTLTVGEQSGRVVESMGTLARQYQERARAAMGILTSVAGWFVWAVVAAVIIALVFRLFSFYLGMINDAGKM